MDTKKLMGIVALSGAAGALCCYAVSKAFSSSCRSSCCCSASASSCASQCCKRQEESKVAASSSSVSTGSGSDGVIVPSQMSRRTFNPIRAIVDTLDEKQINPDKPIIRLSIGDPAIYGNMNVSDEVVQCVQKALLSPEKANGYMPATGSVAACAAIAKHHSTPTSPVTAKDVIITSGCSGALALTVPTLADPGDNILIPDPGFSLYVTICGHFGIEYRAYSCLPDRQWEVDLVHAESLIDRRTRAILINNPSNPCGSNFSQAHLREIVALASKYNLPIISDEVYAGMVFSGQTFYPIASVAGNVPVLTVGGMAKRFVVPGWRVGWIVFHDPANKLAKVRPSLTSMSQVILGANSLVQFAIPQILETSDEWHTRLHAQLEQHAMFCVDKIKRIPGLQVIVPQGTLYLMVRVKSEEFIDIKDDVEFCQKLLKEESLFVLPGKCFRAPNFFRIVYCAPIEPSLSDACERLDAFARRHLKKLN